MLTSVTWTVRLCRKNIRIEDLGAGWFLSGLRLIEGQAAQAVRASHVAPTSPFMLMCSAGVEGRWREDGAEPSFTVKRKCATKRYAFGVIDAMVSAIFNGRGLIQAKSAVV